MCSLRVARDSPPLVKNLLQLSPPVPLRSRMFLASVATVTSAKHPGSEFRQETPYSRLDGPSCALKLKHHLQQQQGLWECHRQLQYRIQLISSEKEKRMKKREALKKSFNRSPLEHLSQSHSDLQTAQPQIFRIPSYLQNQF